MNLAVSHAGSADGLVVDTTRFGITARLHTLGVIVLAPILRVLLRFSSRTRSRLLARTGRHDRSGAFRPGRLGCHPQLFTGRCRSILARAIQRARTVRARSGSNGLMKLPRTDASTAHETEARQEQPDEGVHSSIQAPTSFPNARPTQPNVHHPTRHPTGGTSTPRVSRSLRSRAPRWRPPRTAARPSPAAERATPPRRPPTRPGRARCSRTAPAAR